jgi:acetyl esterase/lipase
LLVAGDGMIRIGVLGIGVVFAGLGLLTVFKSPDWLDWRICVLAGQFGYAIAVIPLCAGLLAWFLPGSRGACGNAACAVCLVAVALLIQPCLQAWAIGRSLPARLSEAFGPAAVDRQPFSFECLFNRWPEPAPKTTWNYSGALQLDFYPAFGRAPAPCVIVIHGGGWDDGDRGQISQFNDGLARSGYAVADISYRLSPAATWPAQRGDVAAAIVFVKAHAPAWNVDAGRLVVMGRSAGGQIAEASAYYLHDPCIRGVIALYAPSDMNFAWRYSSPHDALNSPKLMREFLGGTPETARPAYDSASALLLVDAKSPPTLLVHGAIDTLVWHRHSVRLAARLTEAGVPNLLLSMPWGVHALEFNPSGPSGQLTDYAVDWFLAAVCR